MPCCTRMLATHQPKLATLHPKLFCNRLEGMERQVARNRTFVEGALDAAVTRDGRLRMLKLLG